VYNEGKKPTALAVFCSSPTRPLRKKEGRGDGGVSITMPPLAIVLLLSAI
jgi:hypothetical protein